MGADGSVWVRWGAWSMGGHKNNAYRDNNGRAGPDSGPMAGEISPNIMFCKKKAKGARTAPDGCTWVRMGAVGCICTGGQENKGKRGKNRENRACFSTHVNGQKSRQTSGLVMVVREDNGKE